MRTFAADLTDEGMKANLEAFGDDVGTVTVERTGECDGYTWNVEFITSAGDRPDLTADYRRDNDVSDILFDLTVISLANVSIYSVHDCAGIYALGIL